MPRMRWVFDYQPFDALPPLAWVARVTPPRVIVRCGLSVQRHESVFFEGTWAGSRELTDLPRRTTVLGSGMAINSTDLIIVPPSHALEGVYIVSRPEGLVASNSLVGVLRATGLDLDPVSDYPGRFVQIRAGIGHSPLRLPTSGDPIWYAYYENVLVAPDGSWTPSEKPRERPFASFSDYRRRLSAALGACLANAGERRSVVAMSSGYDSTAAAVLAAELGCDRAMTISKGKPVGRDPAPDDSGARTARRLGMEVRAFDRLAYLRRPDLPEAEFLATGMTGEDVVMAEMEPGLRRSVLISGVGGGVWRTDRPPRTDLWRNDLQGCSLGEFRLRADFFHVPVPLLGASEQPDLLEIGQSAEMRPFSLGGHYDSPIPRRIVEEAGIPRGTFATRKLAASATLHSHGATSFSPRMLESVERFAAAEGRVVVFPRRYRVTRAHRMLVRLAGPLRADRLVRPLERRRRRLIHFAPQIGTLLFRWAVGVVAPRYDAAVDLDPSVERPPETRPTAQHDPERERERERVGDDRRARRDPADA